MNIKQLEVTIPICAICVNCKKECSIVWGKTDNGQRGCEPQGHYEEWLVAESDCCNDEVQLIPDSLLTKDLTLEEIIEYGEEPDWED